jgi:hypothetical protein
MVAVKACLNDARTRAEHPAVPLTPAELAADAIDVRRAGAFAVHVHPRDAKRAETMQAPACEAPVAAIRGIATPPRSCPEASRERPIRRALDARARRTRRAAMADNRRRRASRPTLDAPQSTPDAVCPQRTSIYSPLLAMRETMGDALCSLDRRNSHAAFGTAAVVSWRSQSCGPRVAFVRPAASRAAIAFATQRYLRASRDSALAVGSAACAGLSPVVRVCYAGPGRACPGRISRQDEHACGRDRELVGVVPFAWHARVVKDDRGPLGRPRRPAATASSPCLSRSNAD